MKSLLTLPSKEFVDFLTNEVQEWEQINRLGCTFWWKGEACFCQVVVLPYYLDVTIRPVSDNVDIGNGCGNSIEKQFKRDDTALVQISHEQAKFLDDFATSIYALNEKNESESWYFCPFYFKKNKNGTFEVVSFENIPKYLIDFIQSQREANDPA